MTTDKNFKWTVRPDKNNFLDLVTKQGEIMQISRQLLYSVNHNQKFKCYGNQ